MSNHRSGGTFTPVSLNSPDSSLLKTCALCKSSLGLGLGILHDKKYTCKFCNRDVCGRCSLSRKYNETLGKYVRCCDDCLRSSISVLISHDADMTVKQVQEEIAQTMHDIEYTERQLGEAMESQPKLKAAVENLEEKRRKQTAAMGKLTEEKKLELRELVGKNEILKKEKEELVRKYAKLQGLAGTSQSALQMRKQDLEKATQDLREVKRQLETLQEERRTLARARENLTRTRSESVGLDKKSLRKRLKELHASEGDLKKEVEGLRLRSASLQRETETREAEILSIIHSNQRLVALEREVRQLQQSNIQLHSSSKQ